MTNIIALGDGTQWTIRELCELVESCSNGRVMSANAMRTRIRRLQATGKIGSTDELLRPAGPKAGMAHKRSDAKVNSFDWDAYNKKSD